MALALDARLMSNNAMNTDPVLKAAVDVGAGATVIGSIFGFIPAFAAIFGIVWYSILIWESKTVQYWVNRWRGK
jgi:hypothetical protein